MNEKDLLAYKQMLDGCESKFAVKALDYMDGKQTKHLECLLSDPNKGRKDWVERGIIPRTRNLTKMIVEKSGLLFNDAAPTLQIFNQGDQEADEGQTQALMDLMDEMEWQEFFINVDMVTRLLKTSVVLIQFDAESQMLNFDLLHRGNCEVILNANNKQINTIVYQTGCCGEEVSYRVIQADSMVDFTVSKNKVTAMFEQENPYGMVPAVAFYDTGVPRTGFWSEAPQDLVSINELYNLHVTDSEYVMSWAKLKTLFTNCRLDGAADEFHMVQHSGDALPRMAAGGSSIVGGPGVSVFLDTSGVESPYIEYKGPDVNIEPLDNVVNKWIRDFASDWSVRVKGAGEAAATSGFQLVVEEMDNLDLRKTRQRMFEAGFKRMFRSIRGVVNTIKPGTFNEDATLFAGFKDPVMPVDQKAEEEVWSIRLANGRASRLDYFMETKGMSKEEAQAKIEEIDSTAKSTTPRPPTTLVKVQRDLPPSE